LVSSSTWLNDLILGGSIWLFPLNIFRMHSSES
jgi:hypothetical protein